MAASFFFFVSLHSLVTTPASLAFTILPQWWSVDLGADATVTSMVIYNRGGCGGVCQRE
jgi:hypothetical protein